MFLKTVGHTIEKWNMLSPSEPVLCALSGGADSVCMLLALQALHYSVSACHLNHALRGAEADRDEQFVKNLCQARGVLLYTEKRDVRAYAREHSLSLETAAREVRYAFFADAGRALNISKIATAHTADDNLETILFHLTRGTGLRGLAGIPPVRDCFIRPLIAQTREAVLDYLNAENQPFVTDSTNLSDDYTRNRMRHEVIPVLRSMNPQLAVAAARLSEQVWRDNAALDEQAAHFLQNGKISCRVLCGIHEAVATRVLRLWLAQRGIPLGKITEAHFRALLALCRAENPSGRVDLPTVRIGREYDRLIIVKDEIVSNEMHLSIPFSNVIWDNRAILTGKNVKTSEHFYKSLNTFAVNCDTINLETFSVRTRRAGDKMRMNQNSGHISLKKRMINQKIPREKRDHLAVFADCNGVIAVEDIGVNFDRLPQGEKILILAVKERKE